MDISIFDVVGPVMIGPSSSHTAGAARLARAAAKIAAVPFTHVSFGLHGSFAKTYRGHGTDKALVAGVLGFKSDDEQLKTSFEIAAASGLTCDFYETELEGMHDNSVLMTFTLQEGGSCTIAGSSIGGGQIVITNINGTAVDISASGPTLIITQKDKKGVISEVTKILADYDINIGIMKVSRTGKGQQALCVIESDNQIDDRVVSEIASRNNVISVKALCID